MISIVIPALNEEKYLPKLLESIKKQDFNDYEIIVADANSRDKTRQIAKKFKCRVVDGGLPAEGRNNGAKAAKGNILFFIDADCQINNNFFKKALNQVENMNLDVAACFVRPLSKKILDNASFAFLNCWIYITQSFFPHASGAGIFCKKNLHERINGFNEKIKLGEDMDYAKRAGKYGKFGALSSVKTYTSVRRFDKEGRLKLLVKMLISGIYRIVIGEVTTDLFKYRLRYKR